MKAIGRKIEFATLPDGRVAVVEGETVSVLKVEDREFIDMMAELIKRQYPSAWHQETISIGMEGTVPELQGQRA